MTFQTEGYLNGNKNQSNVQNVKFGLIEDAIKIIKML